MKSISFFQVALYRDNQLSFTAEKGVTFGFLKLLYGADSNNASTILLGVKARQGQMQRIISNDLAVLDKDEYDLIVQGMLVYRLSRYHRTVIIETH